MVLKSFFLPTLPCAGTVGLLVLSNGSGGIDPGEDNSGEIWPVEAWIPAWRGRRGVGMEEEEEDRFGAGGGLGLAGGGGLGEKGGTGRKGVEGVRGGTKGLGLVRERDGRGAENGG